MSRLAHVVVIALLLLAILVALVSLDRPLTLRILGVTKSVGVSPGPSKRSDAVSDALTRSVVRKVKVSKVGDYLIVTLVLRASMDSSTEVEIEEPLVLLSDGEVVAKGDSAGELSV